MYGRESYTIKKAENRRIDDSELWCWKKPLRGPWTARRSNQSILKEVNPEYSLERLTAKAEAPILWPPDAKSRLIGKDPDAGKDWGQEKWATEDEMVGWHHQFNGCEFEQTPGESEGQWSLACCSSWVTKTWVSNWTTARVTWRNFKINTAIIHNSHGNDLWAHQ